MTLTSLLSSDVTEVSNTTCAGCSNAADGVHRPYGDVPSDSGRNGDQWRADSCRFQKLTQNVYTPNQNYEGDILQPLNLTFR